MHPIIKPPTATRPTSATFRMWYDDGHYNTTTMMDLVYSFGVMNLGSLVQRECTEENVATCSSAAVSTTQTNGPPIKRSKLSLSLNNNGKMPNILIILYGSLPPHLCFKQNCYLVIRAQGIDVIDDNKKLSVPSEAFSNCCTVSIYHN